MRQHRQHLRLPGRGPLIGLGSLIKNWYQISISIPSLGVGIQGIGPLLNPKPIVGALSPLLHSGLLSGSYACEESGDGVGGGRPGRHHRFPVGTGELGVGRPGGPDGCGRDGRDCG